MTWATIKKLLWFSLFFLLLALSSAYLSADESADYWQEQREYYLQYPAWELPSSAIVEWLNQLETSEAELHQAKATLNQALNTLTGLNAELDQLSMDLEAQQNQLKTQTAVIAAVSTITIFLILIK